MLTSLKPSSNCPGKMAVENPNKRAAVTMPIDHNPPTWLKRYLSWIMIELWILTCFDGYIHCNEWEKNLKKENKEPKSYVYDKTTQECNYNLYKSMFSSSYISCSKLLTFRSSFKADIAVLWPLTPRMLFDKLSNESNLPFSCWKTVSITYMDQQPWL